MFEFSILPYTAAKVENSDLKNLEKISQIFEISEVSEISTVVSGDFFEIVNGELLHLIYFTGFWTRLCIETMNIYGRITEKLILLIR